MNIYLLNIRNNKKKIFDKKNKNSSNESKKKQAKSAINSQSRLYKWDYFNKSDFKPERNLNELINEKKNHPTFQETKTKNYSNSPPNKKKYVLNTGGNSPQNQSFIKFESSIVIFSFLIIFIKIITILISFFFFF